MARVYLDARNGVKARLDFGPRRAYSAAVLQTKLSSDERRRTRRTPLLTLVRLNKGTGICRDISQDGIAVRVSESFALGEHVSLSLVLPDVHPLPPVVMQAEGGVVRVEDGLIGVAFTSTEFVPADHAAALMEEMRKTERRSLAVDVKLNKGHGVTYDISRDGIGVRTAESFALGEHVSVSLVLPDTHPLPPVVLQAEGKVVRVGEGTIGIAFISTEYQTAEHHGLDTEAA